MVHQDTESVTRYVLLRWFITCIFFNAVGALGRSQLDSFCWSNRDRPHTLEPSRIRIVLELEEDIFPAEGGEGRKEVS